MHYMFIHNYLSTDLFRYDINNSFQNSIAEIPISMQTESFITDKYIFLKTYYSYYMQIYDLETLTL